MTKKTCFIITPIGNEGSEIRREIDGIIDEVINPVLKKLGYEEDNVEHRKNNTSSIPGDVVKSVYEADLCIANLTGNNPNVMYELALRHASGKHAIIITDNVSSLPFDINIQRSIEYKNDIKGALELKIELENKIKYIEEHPDEISNPIYDHLQKIIIKDDDLPLKNLDYKESFEKIMTDISELKYTINQFQNMSSNQIPLGYGEVYRKHEYEMDKFKEKINLYSKIEDWNKLHSIIQSLQDYVDMLDKKCSLSNKRKEDAVYNKMYQDALILLNGCKKML